MNPHIPHQKKEMELHVPAINYHLKSEVSIMLCCQLCSTHYTALRIKNCSKSTSAIKVTKSMKNTDDFHYEGKPSHATAKLTSFAASKDKLDTKEDTGKSVKNALHVLLYTKRHVDTCLAEATSNSENIKTVALAVIALV